MIPWLCALALLGEPSFCWAEGLASPPRVVAPGGAASVACEDDGRGALRCTVSAWGPWRAFEVGSVTVAGEWRVNLPMVGR